MATSSRFYKNHIAEGKGILVFSIAFAFIVRIIFYLFFRNFVTSMPITEGYLWTLLASFFENSLVSLIGSSLVVAFIATMAAKINTEYVVIRIRTLLPPAIIVLLFSCHPALIQLSPAYIGVLFMFFIISTLFSSYNSVNNSMPAFKVSFILSLGSLFTPVLLLYIPFTWIALMIMRCFNFKSIFTSLFGIFIIYFPIFSFYLFTENLDAFYKPFLSVGIESLMQLPVLSLNIMAWILLGLSVILFSLIIGNDFINSHKDKIRTRAFLSLLSFVTLSALSLFLFLNISPEVNLYIVIGIGALLLSHFFALIEKKSGIILFYIYSFLYFVTCILSYLSIL